MARVHIVINSETNHKAIYLDDQLVMRCNEVNYWQLLEALGIETSHEFQGHEWFYQQDGRCPTYLE